MERPGMLCKGGPLQRQSKTELHSFSTRGNGLNFAFSGRVTADLSAECSLEGEQKNKDKVSLLVPQVGNLPSGQNETSQTY